MDLRTTNDLLLRGELDRPGLFPHLEELAFSPVRFEPAFGLGELPAEPGVLFIRGARQYGKSTWLEARLRETVAAHGPGTALYLNGDTLVDEEALERAVLELVGLFSPRASVRRIFIDEVTAVPGFVRVLKRLLDRGELRRILVVTTGSKATDLRRGSERLPGRKGRLARTSYFFTPVPFAEFLRATGREPGPGSWVPYLLSGGSPLALGELHTHGALPEHVLEMIRDWLFGEFSASGRGRRSLLSVLGVLAGRGGTPLGQTKLAREAGLANNTVAAGYLELLFDLLCVGESPAWDAQHQVPMARKPAKYPFLNTLVAAAFHPARLRRPADFVALPEPEQAPWLEWLVAQELWRRRCIGGEAVPEQLPYWQAGEREVDFVVGAKRLLEVKRGRAGALDFTWFPRTFPGARLTVVSSERFETRDVVGITMDDFLLGREER
jgi:predicted AAA+ superfamily ATPase